MARSLQQTYSLVADVPVPGKRRQSAQMWPLSQPALRKPLRIDAHEHTRIKHYFTDESIRDSVYERSSLRYKKVLFVGLSPIPVVPTGGGSGFGLHSLPLSPALLGVLSN
jgi:hypothetical protein